LDRLVSVDVIVLDGQSASYIGSNRVVFEAIMRLGKPLVVVDPHPIEKLLAAYRYRLDSAPLTLIPVHFGKEMKPLPGFGRDDVVAVAIYPLENTGNKIVPRYILYGANTSIKGLLAEAAVSGGTSLPTGSTYGPTTVFDLDRRWYNVGDFVSSNVYLVAENVPVAKVRQRILFHYTPDF
jgi:hypothetical protein